MTLKLTILHELLHLHTTPIEPEKGTLGDTAMEQMVHQLSLTLRALEKEKSR